MVQVRFILSKLSESLFLTVVASFALYWILSQIIDYPDYSNTLSGFFYWAYDLFTGQLMQYAPEVDVLDMSFDEDTESAKPIEVFSNTGDSIGNHFLHTFGLSITCLSIGIIFSLSLNVLIIFSRGFASKFARITEASISFVSGIHVILLSFFLYDIIRYGSGSFSTMFIVLLVICGSNVFYNISSQQHITLLGLKGADYILASKAWGDSSLIQMRRTILLLILNQFTTMLAPVLTNTIIIEIIFQRDGLGSVLFYEIFSDVKIGGVDIGIIIAITLFLILLIQISNLTRQSIEKILLEYR
tara:strand:+ start:1201 stop:2103 length:903 start_codon:yes stop_codon:yes gene_type:complete